MALRSFRDLNVWQKSIELIDDIYRLSRNFPKSEMYGLCSQVQRAAVSVAANIAEGSGRDSTKEFMHHLAFSLGSLAEVETYWIVSQRLGYVDGGVIARLDAQCDSIGKMIRSLQKALRRKLADRNDSPN